MLALRTLPETAERIRIEGRKAGRPEGEIEQEIDSQKRYFVDGYSRVDPETDIAIVTITGLKQPFEDRVNLSAELRP